MERSIFWQVALQELGVPSNGCKRLVNRSPGAVPDCSIGGLGSGSGRGISRSWRLRVADDTATRRGFDGAHFSEGDRVERAFATAVPPTGSQASNPDPLDFCAWWNDRERVGLVSIQTTVCSGIYIHSELHSELLAEQSIAFFAVKFELQLGSSKVTD